MKINIIGQCAAVKVRNSMKIGLLFIHTNMSMRFSSCSVLQYIVLDQALFQESDLPSI